MPEISIIVPVYKVEQYLPRCIDSILAQTFTDFELLLIDDGSPDNCGKICDDYAAKDARVRVFHKENGGVSSARNLGLDNAVGKYIGFVDSDDYIFPKMYETLLSCFAYDVQLSCVSVYTDQHRESSSPVILNSDETIETCFLSSMWTTIWNKLFLREYVDHLRFDISLQIAEDVLFLSQYLKRVRSSCFINSTLYVYCDNQSSATRDSTVSRKAINIPVVDKRIIDEFNHHSRSVKNKLYYWSYKDISLWIHKVNDRRIQKEIIRKAFPIRIKTIFNDEIYWKSRILFVLGMI
ncbi:MAG: glycosyltransferase [Lachnospiraceae bacterium]|nr:glycosyltransferase [Lachnospiraceae bacterium]